MDFPARFAQPNQAFGYARSGTGVAGPPTGWKGEYGVATQGVGMVSQGQVNVGGTDWHPTILYLLGLTVLEMIVFGILAKMLR